MQCFHKLSKYNHFLFGEIAYYVPITKFQSQGNQHDHGLLQIINVPKYDSYNMLDMNILLIITQQFMCCVLMNWASTIST
jgi:hypothetical protein